MVDSNQRGLSRFQLRLRPTFRRQPWMAVRLDGTMRSGRIVVKGTGGTATTLQIQKYDLCQARGPVSPTFPGSWHTSMRLRERAVLAEKSSITRGMDGGRHWESLLRDGGPKPGGRFGPRRRRQAPSLTTTHGSERVLRHTGVVIPPGFRHRDVTFGSVREVS